MEEFNAQLVSLVGENGAEMLISAFINRKTSQALIWLGKLSKRIEVYSLLCQTA